MNRKGFLGSLLGASILKAESKSIKSRYIKSFAGITTLTIFGYEHQMGTPALFVACYTLGPAMQIIEMNSLTIDAATFNITITFTTPQDGLCVLR